MENLRLEPLGDQAVMAYCADEMHATRLTAQLRQTMPPWCIDIVQAYVSVAVFYDIAAIDFTDSAQWLQAISNEDADAVVAAPQLHLIPCCYELGLHFERIRKHSGLSTEQII